MRAFIAIPVPKIELRLPKIEGIRPIVSDNLHITLKFFPNISLRDREEIDKRLKFLNDVDKFMLKFKGIGAFPTATRPRVIWIGVKKGAGQIMQIKKKLDRVLREFVSLEQKVFYPHMTVARVRRVKDRGKLKEFIEHYKKHEFSEFSIEKLVFIKSILKYSGAEYSLLSKYHLADRFD